MAVERETMEIKRIDTASLCASVQNGSAEERIRALSKLCVMAKKAAGRREIETVDGIHKTLGTLLLNAEEPKIRKNAARLLGELSDSADADTLIRALQQETTRFIIPSILLALGNVGGEAALDALNAYTDPQPQSIEEEKHCAEIAEAHAKALSALQPHEAPMIHAFSSPQKMLLLHPQGFTDILISDLNAAQIPSKAVSQGVMVKIQDLDKLYKVRTFFEALIPCSIVERDASAIAAASRLGWAAFSTADESGAPMLPYRVELKDFGDERIEMIRSVAKAVGGVNDPSSYSFEIRVRRLADGRAAVYVKPCTVRDVRFSYRLGKLPASIHPVTAAALARTAAAMLSQQEGVLRAYDPCCGSGTLLVEAARAHGGRSILMGTDIAAEAVDIAKKNLTSACCNATILRKDCLRFEARDPFDLLITNLPFGNRVGTHDSIEPLYRELAGKLKFLVRPGGVAVLYTMEGKLLEQSLKRAGLSWEKVVRTDAGGLFPRAYFIRMS